MARAIQLQCKVTTTVYDNFFYYYYYITSQGGHLNLDRNPALFNQKKKYTAHQHPDERQSFTDHLMQQILSLGWEQFSNLVLFPRCITFFIA